MEIFRAIDFSKSARLSQRASIQSSRFALLFLMMLFLFIPTNGIAEDNVASSLATPQDTRTPSSSPEEAVDRFLKECVLIDPVGNPAMFPKSMKLGSDAPDSKALPAETRTFTKAFRISRYETTQELYSAVMGENPSRWKGPRNSAEMMNFDDAIAFCRGLTTILRERKLISNTAVVRLPTEDEWEYCCRAGTTSAYSFGNQAASENDVSPQASILDEYGWHTGNAAGNDPAVGVLKPNPWGLYDMHGYLSEYVTSVGPAADNPQADNDRKAVTGSLKVIRGGSWKDHYSELTSAFRKTIAAEAVSDAVGFRCIIAENP
ncbi:MAG: formylglycine-generating enzyme family protein [Planctomyces sp.]|jgi:formylglycine-generating enzyme required for sulfatase activity